MYAKRKWLSQCAAQNALLDLLTNQIIILVHFYHKKVSPAAPE